MYAIRSYYVPLTLRTELSEALPRLALLQDHPPLDLHPQPLPLAAADGVHAMAAIVAEGEIQQARHVVTGDLAGDRKHLPGGAAELRREAPGLGDELVDGVDGHGIVITSYSIHYTKLYDGAFEVETRLESSWDTNFHDRPRVLAFPLNRSALGEHRVLVPMRALESAGLVQAGFAPDVITSYSIHYTKLYDQPITSAP